MEFHTAHIRTDQPLETSDCLVPSSARLVEVFQKTASGGHPYLFVADDAGNPVGLLAAEDVLRRVTDPNPQAMTRWMDMPAESALQSRILMPEAMPQKADQDTSYTRVSRDGRLLGIVTDDDVLISWKSIQNSLKASQDDSVTGLPNRMSFDQSLEAELNRARRSRTSLSVVLVDLDYFKPINDNFGHGAGDTALRIVGNTLRGSLRSYDMVARFGGDEFAVACSGCRPNEIDIVVRRLRERVLELQDSFDGDHPLPTVSVGAAVAHQPWDIESPDQLLLLADTALYAAKDAGRNCAWKIELQEGRKATPEFVEDRYSHSEQPMAAHVGDGRY